MTTVFLVDDHEIVRRGLADLVRSQSDLEIVGEAGTVRQAVGRIEATMPDVAVLDMRLPTATGSISVVTSARACPPSPVSS